MRGRWKGGGGDRNERGICLYGCLCQRVREREKGELATNLYISSLCIGFLDYVHMYHSNSQLTH